MSKVKGFLTEVCTKFEFKELSNGCSGGLSKYYKKMLGKNPQFEIA